LSSIVVIGSGNIATCFGKAFHKAGVSIRAVCSQTPLHANVLANELSSKAVSSFFQLPIDADFYLLAIKDSAIKDVSDKLNVNGIVLHCSGITSIDVLNNHQNFGVIWPVQTITKNHQLQKNELPLCVEGNNKTITNKIQDLANQISTQVTVMNFEQRKYAHLAAVISNNLSNHLFDMAANILNEHHLPFEILHSIISETARKVQHSLPAEVQTGPAKRNDTGTLKQHLELLKDYPDYAKIYEAISASIINQNK